MGLDLCIGRHCCCAHLVLRDITHVIILFLRKELNLLQKLYGLYDTVMGSISGYYEILWGDVDIEKINAELLEFQNR